jgi:squalene-hopene/tetraprenyl-beta-curcumene cyclase
LPFDTSCPDITAHFLRAAEAWQSAGAATRAGHRSLARTQRADGSWEPLWFGNQHHPTQANPAYGTARVVLATLDPRGAAWLIDAVQPDGGVGTAASLCRRPSNGNPL